MYIYPHTLPTRSRVSMRLLPLRFQPSNLSIKPLDAPDTLDECRDDPLPPQCRARHHPMLPQPRLLNPDALHRMDRQDAKEYRRAVGREDGGDRIEPARKDYPTMRLAGMGEADADHKLLHEPTLGKLHRAVVKGPIPKAHRRADHTSHQSRRHPPLDLVSRPAESFGRLVGHGDEAIAAVVERGHGGVEGDVDGALGAVEGGDGQRELCGRHGGQCRGAGEGGWEACEI